MALSSDLISQFVKVTNDNKKTKKDTTVYGTIKEENENKYIQLDGSTEKIPVTSSTVTVSKDDRVTVMIKNHKAVVTGNLTSPAVEKITLQETVKTEVAEIDKLYAKQATVDELKADVIEVNELTAKKVDTEEFTTKVAEINDLVAKKVDTETFNSEVATINNLIAEKASIDQLNAVEGTIENLDSEIAEIDKLIFGSAGGDVIQSEFANAVVAQIGDAQIKSAMIESIDTSKVEVKSGDDGKLLIADETIQISDANRLRVQIGEDGNGDYTINVWNQNGDLIFNSSGITDKAIADGLIRNSMISDTANISSSKIYLDEEAQTLDVAFKSLISTVTTQGETITSQGATITANKEAIDTKIWQQDIDTAKDELSTEYSSLEQTVENITMTVAEHIVKIDDNETRISTAQTTINQLTDAISMLVTDANGGSLMTQTADGWTFSTAEIQNTVDSISTELDELTSVLGGTKQAVEVLQKEIVGLNGVAEYVKITTYDSEPCIELGEGDSNFKLRITNTKIMFMDGSNVPAYVSNNSLYIKKAIIEEELQQGGFVWVTRSNNHLSLVWKGVES